MDAFVQRELAAIVGEANIKTQPDALAAYGTDWTRVHKPNPIGVVLPASTQQVSQIVKFCQKHNIAMVPSGGRTGLAGGAVASAGELVISLSRMNRIEKLDAVGLTAVVEAGVTTQALQEAAREIGLFFPLDLAAKGSCQIGGNIATNAGGVKFIRFGGMREQVLGVEVVLPNGDILDMNTGLRKNNTGYDLKQLFVGAEGTLGIITRATVKLAPPPRNLQVAVMATRTFGDILQIAQTCNLQGIQLTAFEFFTNVAHEIVLKYSPGAKTPFAEKSPFYVLLEVEEGDQGRSVMEPLLATIFEKGLIEDAVIGQSSAQFKELWGLRENITESIANHGHVRKNDISLAIDQLEMFVKDLEKEVLSKAPSDMQLVLFGHIGDGNLHINYVGPKSEPFVDFQSRARKVEEQVFAILARYKGSISAEHGIGLLKKHDLLFSRSAAEIAMMQNIKRLFDPKNLMNPGKIFEVG